MRTSPEAAKDTRFYQRAKEGTLCVYLMHKGIMYANYVIQGI